jgi:hypothetical protein
MLHPKSRQRGSSGTVNKASKIAPSEVEAIVVKAPSQSVIAYLNLSNRQIAIPRTRVKYFTPLAAPR